MFHRAKTIADAAQELADHSSCRSAVDAMRLYHQLRPIFFQETTTIWDQFPLGAFDIDLDKINGLEIVPVCNRLQGHCLDVDDPYHDNRRQ